MEKFLEKETTNSHSKRNILKNPTSVKEIEILEQRKLQAQMISPANFNKHLRKKFYPKSSRSWKKEHLPTHFMRLTLS